MKFFTRIFLVILTIMAITQPALPEGTKQVQPNSANTCQLDILNPTSNYKNWGSYLGTGADEKIYIHVKDYTTEHIYWGLNPSTGGSIYYRIKDPSGTIVVGPSLVPSSGLPGYINTYAEAVAGPSALAAGGYNALSYTPLQNGDYSIEFNLGSPATPSTGEMIFNYYDFTVGSNVTNQPILGRLWSQAWGFNTAAQTTPANSVFYVYTADSVVTSLDMNAMNPFGFSVVCNKTGVSNTGNVSTDRKSVSSKTLYAQYKIFLNNPDPSEYPSGSSAGLNATPSISGCPTSGYCIQISPTQACQASIFIDFNNNGAYDAGTRDVQMVQNLNKGPNCVAWNGKDGLGNLVTAGLSLSVNIKVISGLTNFPIYDAEYNTNGVKVAVVRPSLPPPLIFWDDSGIPATNTFDAASNLSGASSPAHKWDNVSGGFGNNRTINTWWYTYSINATFSFTVVNNCPPVAGNDNVSTCLNTASTFNPISNDTDPENNINPSSLTITQSPKHGSYTVNGGGTITYTPNAGYTGLDTLVYSVCDFTSLCTSANVYITVNPSFSLSKTDICGASTGSLVFSASAATFKYGYSSGGTYTGAMPPATSTVAGANTISGLAAGTYTVRLYDPSIGCYTDQTATIISNPNPSLTLSKADYCGATPNGSITFPTTVTTYKYDYSSGASYSGAVPPSAYASVNGTNTINGLAAGTFTVRLYNSSTGCYTDQSIAISSTAGTPPTLTLSKTDICGATATGSITFNPGVGTFKYGYTTGPVYTGGTPSTTALPSVTNTISSLAAGTYTVRLLNTVSGCFTDATISVVDNNPVLALTNNNICGAGTGSLTFPTTTTAYKYAYNTGATYTGVMPPATATVNGTNTIGSLAAGTYTVRLYNPGNTCYVTKTVTIASNAKPTLTSFTKTDICTGSVGNISFTSTTTSLLYGYSSGASYTGAMPPATSTVNGTNNIINLSTGTYTARLYDPATGCYSDQSATINDNRPVYSGALTKTDACGAAAGGISFPTTVTTYRYAYTSGSSYTGSTPTTATVNGTNSISGLAGGTYTVRLYDPGNTCYKDSTKTVNNNNPILGLSASAVCGSATNGSVSFGTTVTTYKYGYSSGATYTGAMPPVTATVNGTNTIGALAAGTYTVRLYDPAFACYTDQTISVISNPNPTLTLSKTDVCGAATNGTISFPATVTTLRYDYTTGGSYTGGTPATATVNGTNTISALAAGTYTIRLYNPASGCYTDQSSTISSISVPSAPMAGSNSPVCTGKTLNLTASIIAGATYAWTGPSGFTASVQNPSNAGTTASMAGTYSVTVTVAGCTSSAATTTVVINATPSVTITNPSAVCASSSVDLTVAAVTAGSTAGLTYTYWTNAAATTALASPGAVVSSGTYYIKGTTAAGCFDIQPVTVTVNPKPTVIITNPSAVCSPSTIDITASAVTAGSTAGLTYTYWTNAGATIALASPGAVSTSGTYYIKGTISATGCNDIKPVTVTVNPKPTVTITNPSAVCSPSTVDITAAAVTAGSTAGLTYTYWTNAGATTSLASPASVASSGTYYIKGTVAVTGCFDVQPVSVTINPKPTVVITNPSAVCSPVTVDITAAAVTAGSTAGLTYTYWTNAGATTALASPGAVSSSGTYYIKGTVAATGCNDIQPVTVTINPKPTVAITNPSAVCVPSTVDITAAAVTSGSTAGLTYSYWTNAGASTALASPGSVSASGTYYIKGTTGAGCFDIQPVTVTVNPKPTVSITNPSAVCSPSTVDVTAAGVTAGSTAGLTYTYWTNAGATTALASPSAVSSSGTYYIKGTVAATGCNDIQPVTVTVNPKPTVSITNPSAVCSPSTVDITAAPVISGSTAGLSYTYWTNAGATTALASPGAVSSSGTYYIKGTTAAGCFDIQPVIVTINSKPTVTITNPSAVCSPSTVDITASAVTAGSTAGLTYTYWANAGATTALASPGAVASSGTYYIKGTTAAACFDIQPVTVTINPKPTVTITNPASVCASTTVDITAASVTTGSTAGLTYTYWTNAGATTALASPGSVSASGTYYIKGTTGAGCSDIQPVTVTINPKPTVTITNPSAVCSPSTVDITASAVTAGSTAGLTYTYWTNAGATTALASPGAVASSGTYYVKGTTAAGCFDIQPVTATVNPKPTVSVTNPSAVCSPSTVDITAASVTTGSTAGLTYTYWTNAGATTALASPNLVSASGTYYIKGTVAATGCNDIQPVTVTINPKPTVTITNPSAVCSPSTVDIAAAAVTAGSTAGLTYTYWTNAAATTALASPGAVSTSGTYYIKGTVAATGCNDIQPVTVTINPKPTVVITNPSAVCSPSTVDITAAAVTAGSTAGLTYTYWTNAGATTALASPGAVASSGTYYIKGTTAAGCFDIQPVTVTINPKPTVSITNPSAVCSPSTVDITAASVTTGSTAGLTYTYWTNAGATTALASPNSVSVSGIYYIKGTVAATGCNDIQPVTVTINPKPTVTITNPSAVCSPSTVDITVAAVTAGSTAGLTYTYWTNAGATTALASPGAVSTSGTYYIKGSVAATGCNDIKPVTVTVNPKPAVVITNPSAVCASTTVDITAAAITAGSTAGLTYTYWTDAGATTALGSPGSVSASGTYYIKGVTGAGCSDIQPVTVTINPKPTVAITGPSAVCSPSTVDITASAVTAGSTAGLTYTYWTNAAATTALASPAAVSVSGTYYIKGTVAATGCTDIQPVSVTINPKPTVSITDPSAVCSPSTVDITAAAVIAGSTAGLTYTYWTNAGATTALASPGAVSTSGTYYIKGTVAATGCNDIKPVTVTINPKPTVIIANPSAVCSPSTVDITAAAVTAGSTSGLTYTYWINAGATTALASPGSVSASGTYYIKGTTGAGCSDIQPVTVIINPKPTVTITNPSAVCAPSTVDITASAVTAGSTAGLTYTYWTNAGATTALASPGSIASSGTYYIKGTTAAGCFDIQPVTVTINPKPTVSITNPSAVCSPSTVDITAASVTTGSTAGLTYTYWTNAGATTALASPGSVSASGTYYIKGTTGAGCSDIQPVTVTINPKPAVAITNPGVSCSVVDITLSSVTSGSTAGLAYTYWTDAAATASLSNPTAISVSGTYYIKGTTAAGCYDIQPVNVSLSSIPTLVITNPSSVCSPSTIDLTAASVTSGSSPGLTYTYWTNSGATTALASPNSISVSGTYYIKGTNGSGCYDVKSVAATINPKTTVAITNPSAVCVPSTVDITAAAVTSGSTAGLTYSYWTNAGASTALASPGSVSASGTYYIKGTTGAGCFDIQPVTVTVNPKPTVTITNPSAVCSPSTVDVTAAGVTAGSTAGLTYTYWTNAGATTALASSSAVSSSGTYYIKGTVAATGCNDIQPVTVTVNPKPTVSVANPSAVCSPTTVDITAASVTTGSTAGLTYTYWTNAGATTALASPGSVSASGTYYIKGTTGAGCSDIQPVTVTINPKPTVTITNPSAVCSPSTVDITASAVTSGSTAGLTYTYWTNAGATTALASPGAVASSGTYYIKGTTAAGCFDIQPVTVTINPKPTVTITNPASVCAPTTVDITAASVTTGSTAGLTYTYWTNAGATTALASPGSVSASGTYYIKGTTGAGCSDIQPVTVTINPKPTVTITNPSAVCSPSTVDITASAVTAGSTAGLTYTYWTNAGATTALASPGAVASSGTYYIKGTTAAGCFDIQPVTVTINPKPTVSVTNPSAVCSPSTVDITSASVTTGSTAGLTYTYWTNTGATTALASPNSVSASGTYYIKGTVAATGCSDIQPVTVTINPKPTVTITNPSAVCSPSTVDIAAAAVTAGSTAGLTYTYWTNAAATTALASPGAVSTSGTYYIKGTVAATGCNDIKPVTVTVNPKPTVAITNPSAVCAPTTVDITAAAVTVGSTAGLTYTYWTNAGATTALVSPGAVASSGTYYIKGTTAAGCFDIQPVTVTINPKPTVVVIDPSPVCSPSTIDLTIASVTAGSTSGLTYNYWLDATATAALATPAAVSNSGTYYIMGTTGAGCSDIQQVTVTINPRPTVVVTDPSSVCSPSTIDLSVASVTSGSTSGLTYSYWLDAAATAALATPAAVSTSGTYYIKGMTGAGCSDIQPVTATINPKPAVVVTDPSSVCSPSAIDLTVASVTSGSTSGLTYSYWLDSAATAAVTTPAAVSNSGTYYIKGVTGAGCSDIQQVTVTINSRPTVVVTDPSSVCSPSTIDLTAIAVTSGSTPGLTYSYWTDAVTTNALSAPGAVSASGTYYIKGMTGAGCSDVQPVTVTINPSPSITVTDPSGVCAPSTIDITAASVTAGSTSGLTYTYWTNTAATSSLASAGAVSVSGTYYIKGTTAAGCYDIKAVAVTINPKPSVIVAAPSAVCTPSTVDIIAASVTSGSTSGLTYSYWTNSSATSALSSPSAVSASGTYYIKGTDAATCFDIQPVTVIVSPTPSVLVTNPPAVCAPAGVDLTAASVTSGSSSGLAYSYWTDAAATATLASPNAVVSAGTYYIKGVAAGGCYNVQPVQVTVNSKPTVVTTNPTAVCAPSTVDITTTSVTSGSTAGLTYTYWANIAATSPFGTPDAVTASGTYYIKGTTGAGCSDIQPVNVTVNPKPSIVINDPATVCAPATVDITAAAITSGSSSGLTYTYWTDAAATAVLGAPNAVASSGTYYIRGTNPGGCSDVRPVAVTIDPCVKIGASVVASTSAAHDDGSFTITYSIVVKNYGNNTLTNVQANDLLDQTFGTNVSFSIVSLTATGNLVPNTGYSGIAANANLLSSSSTLSSGESQQLLLTLSVIANGTNGPFTTQVTVHGTGPGGIIATDIATDGSNPDLNSNGNASDPGEDVPTVVILPAENMFIPEGFSPNGDGIHDRFVIEHMQKLKASIEIFNRWGELVYESKDYRNDWDGKCNVGIHIGSDLPIGTYYYVIEFSNGNKVSRYITLSR